jgi:hypothetical protein
MNDYDATLIDYPLNKKRDWLAEYTPLKEACDSCSSASTFLAF